jgi:hypothetical protein
LCLPRLSLALLSGSSLFCPPLFLPLFLSLAVGGRLWGDTYEYERPRRLPMIMRQMIHEETHYAAHDNARQELHEAQAMEGYAWVD